MLAICRKLIRLGSASLIAGTLLALHPAEAGVDSYRLAPVKKDSTQISFRLPYTLGTHDGVAQGASGSVTVDLLNPKGAKGSFKVPIQSLDTGHSERDCHMREALGLDYTASGYPEEHVCDDQDQLPATGGNSIVHPEIEFQVSGVRPRAPSERISVEQESLVEVDGEWKIHGVTRSVRMPMKVTPTATGFRLQGETVFALKAYGVEVKSAKILIATISVGEEAKVKLDLFFDKVSGAATETPINSSRPPTKRGR